MEGPDWTYHRGLRYTAISDHHRKRFEYFQSFLFDGKLRFYVICTTAMLISVEGVRDLASFCTDSILCIGPQLQSLRDHVVCPRTT